MDHNVGGKDRLARLVVGPLLVLAGLAVVLNLAPLGSTLARTVVALVLLVVGGVLIGTATTRKCPLNEAAGVNTYEETES